LDLGRAWSITFLFTAFHLVGNRLPFSQLVELFIDHGTCVKKDVFASTAGRDKPNSLVGDDSRYGPD
jgi:hypothetical protein